MFLPTIAEIRYLTIGKLPTIEIRYLNYPTENITCWSVSFLAIQVQRKIKTIKFNRVSLHHTAFLPTEHVYFSRARLVRPNGKMIFQQTLKGTRVQRSVPMFINSPTSVQRNCIRALYRKMKRWMPENNRSFVGISTQVSVLRWSAYPKTRGSRWKIHGFSQLTGFP